MTTYCIENGHSEYLSEGIQSERAARKAAQSWANKLSETVYLSDSDCTGEPVEFEPEVARGMRC